MGGKSQKTDVFETHQSQLCSINSYFSVISQLVTRVKRRAPAGALAIMDSYSQLTSVALPIRATTSLTRVRTEADRTGLPRTHAGTSTGSELARAYRLHVTQN